MSSAEFVPGMLCVNMSSGANLKEMSSYYCLQKIRNMTYFSFILPTVQGTNA